MVLLLLLFIIIIMIIINAFKCNLKELKTKSARGPQLFDMYMPSISPHPSSEFSGASAMRFLLAIFFPALPPYLRNEEKHSSMSCISSYSSFVLKTLPAG